MTFLFLNFFSTHPGLKNNIPVVTQVNDEEKDLITTPFLSTFSIAINDILSLFICLSCGSGHTTAGLLQHLKKKHSKTGLTKEDKAQIQMIAESSNISHAYPNITSSNEPPEKYSGLPVHHSAGCPYCPFVNSTTILINQHIKGQHPGLGGKPQKDVPTQVINRGVTKNLFRVVIPNKVETEISDNPVLKEFQDFDWKATEDAQTLPNARMISPWLMQTGWHMHTQGHDPQQLCDLVAMPDNDAFPQLHQNITQYFEAATDLLDDTDELVLQRINTADPEKT
jgi:hypothetical protein